ncbi:hypothetical protein H4R35_005911 [Dimargaris xerosporica]|nr:hypothetical protein H4R35_005911 [Dimargaris xerosporica]
MKFGSFNELCKLSSLPVCLVFSINPQPDCSIDPIPASNDNSVRLINLGDFIITLVSLILITYIAFRIKRKYAAVGRMELSYLYFLYSGILICQVFALDWLFVDVSAWFACIYVALVTAIFWLLMLNGIVGFQFIPDGSRLSLLTTLGSAVAIFITALYVTIDTHLGLSAGLDPYLDNDVLYSPALYVIYYLVPIIAIGLFLVCQTAVVCHFLSVRKPLVYLYGSLMSFALGQVFLYVVSKPLCQGANSVDGLMFATFFTTVSFCLLYFHWSSITADEWEEYGAVLE